MSSQAESHLCLENHSVKACISLGPHLGCGHHIDLRAGGVTVIIEAKLDVRDSASWDTLDKAIDRLGGTNATNATAAAIDGTSAVAAVAAHVVSPGDSDDDESTGERHQMVTAWWMRLNEYETDCQNNNILEHFRQDNLSRPTFSDACQSDSLPWRVQGSRK